MSRDAATLLGFDYGTKRIGVAVGQTLTGTATPIETLRTRGSQPDWAAVGRLIEQWQPDALVVGLPLNMDGSEQELTHRARRFTNQLHGRFRLPVHMSDERLSTKEARARAGQSATELDAVAAQVILETWMADTTRKHD